MVPLQSGFERTQPLTLWDGGFQDTVGESLLILIVGGCKNMGLQPADRTKVVVGCSPRAGIPGCRLEKKSVFVSVRISTYLKHS